MFKTLCYRCSTRDAEIRGYCRRCYKRARARAGRVDVLRVPVSCTSCWSVPAIAFGKCRRCYDASRPLPRQTTQVAVVAKFLKKMEPCEIMPLETTEKPSHQRQRFSREFPWFDETVKLLREGKHAPARRRIRYELSLAPTERVNEFYKSVRVEELGSMGIIIVTDCAKSLSKTYAVLPAYPLFLKKVRAWVRQNLEPLGADIFLERISK